MSKGRILFQLSGSIACFKACQLLSKLVQAGHDTEVVATPSALEFVGEATLEGLTGRSAHTQTFARGEYMKHIALIRRADVIVLCPATANMINKLAAGIGDDLVSTLFLAHDFKKPYLIAPAMNANMLQHPATRNSLLTLKSWGIEILETGSGSLACGETGEGRLLEPDIILQRIQAQFNSTADSAVSPRPLSTHPSHTTRTLSVLITSGGTREALDGVRSLMNTSTGRTGAEIASHFVSQGHRVTFLHAVGSALPSQAAKNSRSFQGFHELQSVLFEELKTNAYDVVIHAAAVSDYLVESISSDHGGDLLRNHGGKIDSSGNLTVKLKRSPKLIDELRSISINPLVKIVAFKLTNTSHQADREAAVVKLATHAQPDFIVHNDLSDISADAKTSSGQHFATIFSALDPNNIAKLAETQNKRALAQKLEELILKGAK